MARVTAARVATVLRSDSSGLATAGEWLRGGKCVAFPTETVFGLGANALDESAVLRVFEYKGRPLTDPLIVHVLTPAEARVLLKLDDEAAKLFDALAAAFWPGPLTLVGPAADVIPGPVTAGTGFVGVRVPAHPTARALLEAARVPVAAPSANRFGHVSPTSAAHVLADLGHCPIAVVDPGGHGTTCDVGIESTVVGLGVGGTDLRVFRLGGAPLAELSACARRAGLEVTVRLVGRADQSQGAAPEDDGEADAPGEAGPDARGPGAEAEAEDGDGEALEAPGQLLTHYAPDVPAALCAWARPRRAAAAGAGGGAAASSPAGACLVPLRGCRAPAAALADTVVLDLGGHLRRAAGTAAGGDAGTQLPALAYRSLDDPASDWGDGAGADGRRAGEAAATSPAEAVAISRRAVFASLRWAEAVPGARVVLLCDPLAVPGWKGVPGADALRDRLFRAASGGFAGLSMGQA